MRPAMTTSAPESACRSTCSVGSPPGNWDETVIGLAGAIFRDLVLPAHPAALLPDDRRLLVEACEIRARRAGCRALVLESFTSGRSDFIPAEHGYVERQRVEFSVD